VSCRFINARVPDAEKEDPALTAPVEL